ncbi:MAG: hypothetical protein ABJF11_16655 [Reichenbachiella sp.]|uniref:hypothetical protein n=1 Tax=Reichenbachiella sp. TaxID=2184521 RepID=UPI003264B244
MVGIKKFILTSSILYFCVLSGCSFVSLVQDNEERSFQCKSMMVTLDGQSYSHVDYAAKFTLDSEKVVIKCNLEDQDFEKEFDVRLFKTSADHRYYYYVEGVNNLFILDKSRGTLKFFGSNEKGNRTLPFAGQVFLGSVNNDAYPNL